jgi:hypothetical protein
VGFLIGRPAAVLVSTRERTRYNGALVHQRPDCIVFGFGRSSVSECWSLETLVKQSCFGDGLGHEKGGSPPRWPGEQHIHVIEREREPNVFELGRISKFPENINNARSVARHSDWPITGRQIQNALGVIVVVQALKVFESGLLVPVRLREDRHHVLLFGWRCASLRPRPLSSSVSMDFVKERFSCIILEQGCHSLTRRSSYLAIDHQHRHRQSFDQRSRPNVTSDGCQK